VYVLIDCGYKPGSPAYINTKIKDITKSIREATGGHINIAVITHEHQDHVNGITRPNFTGISLGEAWFALAGVIIILALCDLGILFTSY